MPNSISNVEMIAWLRHLAALGPGVAYGDVEMAEAVLTHLEWTRPVIEAARRWRREEWGSAPSAVIRNSRRHTVDELDESDASMALIDALDALPPSPETPRMSDTPTPETFECFVKQAGEKMCMGCLGEGWGECIYKKYKDTQADLTERARAAAERYGVSTLKDRLIAEIISIAQSEREVAAAEARSEVLRTLHIAEVALRSAYYTQAQRDAVTHYIGVIREAVASPPAPQEETRR